VDTADQGEQRRIPDPALVVLIGASGSGKSAWAAAHYRPAEVVSSDQLRAVVGSGERDLDASADAFSLLDQIVAARMRRGLATVIDTLGLDPQRRRGYLDQARRGGLPAVAVRFDTNPALCRERNRARAVSVPAAVLDAQLRRMRAATAELASEDWDIVVEAGPARLEPAHTPAAQVPPARPEPESAPALSFILHVSRFG
jgi:predicted kinase